MADIAPEPPTRTIIAPGGELAGYDIARASLTIVAPGPKRSHTLNDALELRIGSGPGNDLRLPHDTVSRAHAAIRVDDRGFLLRDLGSKNGTQVDGVAVQSAWLHHGAEITLGEVSLRFEIQRERQTVTIGQRSHLGAMIGASLPIRRAYDRIERFSASTHTVLVEGETGTGKELAARALHDLGPRKDGPFEIVDATTLPRDLVEGELFGWKKGAFTGATADYKGAVARAEGGTLFIDEIGDLDIDLQAKLLRLVEARTYRPLRSGAIHEADFRLVVATRRRLEEAVNQGSFRDDLYYRLSALRVTLPPLRERPSDVPLLMNHFIKADLKRAGRPPHSFPRLPASLVSALKAHPWPGNVRQLKGFVARLVVLSEVQHLRPDDMLQALGEATPAEDPVPEPSSLIEGLLSVPLNEGGGFQAGRRRAIDAWEQAAIAHYLKAAGFVVAEAARLAGMHRQDFHRLMRRQGVKVDDLRG